MPQRSQHKSSTENVSSTLPALKIGYKKPDKENVESPRVLDSPGSSCDQRLCKYLARGLKRYLTCFMAEESKSKSCNILLVHNIGSAYSPKNHCNYYTSMNDEERDEKLKSFITYCKDSKHLRKDTGTN